MRERWKHSHTLPGWRKEHLGLRAEAGKGLENQENQNPPALTAPFDPLGFDP